MKTSEQTNEIASALAKAQGEIEPAPKDRENPYFKSRYTTLAACVTAARPALAKYGLSVVQSIQVNKEIGMLGVFTRIMHSSGQFIESETWCQPKTLSPQDVGSASTYLKRYSYSAMIGIISDDDDDGNAATRPAQNTTYQQPRPNNYQDKDEVLKGLLAKRDVPREFWPEVITRMRGKTAKDLEAICNEVMSEVAAN
jgi:ERF superfamily